MPIVYCSKCGKPVSTRAGSCCRCGEQIASPEETEQAEIRRMKRENMNTAVSAALFSIVLLLVMMILR